MRIVALEKPPWGSVLASDHRLGVANIRERVE